MKRFWDKVNKTSSCWLWLGATNGRGYGRFNSGNNKLKGAHRVAWELSGQALPGPSQHLCHTCDVRLCVNPTHLFVGTRSQNMLDARNKDRGPNQKLNQALVSELRVFLSNNIPLKVLSREYGISLSVLSAIRHNKIWKMYERMAEV